MFLHIGKGESVRKRDVIGIFDLDTATVSRITKNFINENQKKGNIIYKDNDLPRTFILLDGKDGCEVRLSRISPTGLKIRGENDFSEE